MDGLQKSLRLTTPQGFIFILLSLGILSMLAFGDRSIGVLDQDNYIEYFKSTNWDWLVHEYENSGTRAFLISLITEEFGWRMYVILVNLTGVTPEEGVRFTVLLANVLVILSVSNLRRPVIGLLLWIIIPYGLATVGLFQIRQGLAFGIAMLFMTRWHRPTLGALLASTIHTTFAVPALLFASARLFWRRRWLALVGTCTVAVVLAFSASYLFAHFGGRRLETYAGYQDDFTVKLAGLLLIYMVIAVLALWENWRWQDGWLNTLTALAIVDIALVVYLMTSYVVFPFGKGRVWYCVPLFLVFLLPEFRSRNPLKWWLASGVALVLLADTLKNYSEGVFSYFLPSAFI
ncbi:MAG TPA: EpsG family protein [Terriglobales bacterium]